MILKYNSWKRALQAQNGTPSDEAVTPLGTLLTDGSRDERVQGLRGETETVWLALHPEGRLVFVHHLTVHGGGRVSPTVFFTALVGIGPRAYPIRFEPGHLLTSKLDLPKDCPSWSSLKDLDTKEEVEQVEGGPQKEVFTALLPLPPSIANALMDEPVREPWSFMQPVKSAIAAYDSSHHQIPIEFHS